MLGCLRPFALLLILVILLGSIALVFFINNDVSFSLKENVTAPPATQEGSR